MKMLQQEKEQIQKYQETEKLIGTALQSPWLVTQESSPDYESPTYVERILVSEDLVLILAKDKYETSTRPRDNVYSWLTVLYTMAP